MAAKRVARLLSLPRLMLLVVLALGVAGMHTFGHADDAGHNASGCHTATLERGALMMIPDVGHEPSDQPQTARLIDAAGGDGMGGALFVVCLAVLGALGLGLWAAAAARGQARSDLLRLCPVGAAWAYGRGPPLRRLGLRMATLSVSRT